MSSVSPEQNKTEINFNYSSEIFTWKTKGTLSAAGLMGISVLAIGIFVFLHGIHGIPPIGMHMMCTGGGILLIDAIALTILTISHYRIVKSLKENSTQARSTLNENQENLLNRLGINFSKKVEIKYI